MELAWEFYLAHAFWSWLALGALLLAVEVATGTGNFLWPAGCAVLTGVFAASSLSPGLPAEVAVFAVLTIVTVFLSRRYLKSAIQARGPDVNDPIKGLLGAHGQVVGSVEVDRGRVFVNGKEWAAVLDRHGKLEDGAAVTVVGCNDACTLRVRPSERPPADPGSRLSKDVCVALGQSSVARTCSRLATNRAQPCLAPW